MDTPRKAFRRAGAALLVVPILCLGQAAPATADVIGARGPSAERARVERAVVDALVAHGVDATQAKARAAALTDAEAARVAIGIDRLPAAGRADPVTAAAAVLLVLGFVVVMVIALPFILVAKAVKAHADRHASGQVAPPEARDGPPPEPRY
jgi:hypothetical protein